MADVQDHFEIARSTVYTHLNTLKQQGFLVRDNGQYWIGLRFLEFSANARTRKPSYQIVTNHIQGLAEGIEGEVEFLTEEGGRLYTIYHSENVRPDHIRLFLHNTAAGKAILAELPRQRVNEILNRWGQPQTTSNTITDRDVLFKQLDEVSDRGYAYNHSESFDGYHGIGGVINGLDNSPLGGITIGGPVYQVTEEKLKHELSDVLLEAIEEIEAEIESQRASITSTLANR
jgi:DNA-binding IclR family transcriptional regulator